MIRAIELFKVEQQRTFRSGRACWEKRQFRTLSAARITACSSHIGGNSICGRAGRDWNFSITAPISKYSINAVCCPKQGISCPLSPVEPLFKPVSTPFSPSSPFQPVTTLLLRHSSIKRLPSSGLFSCRFPSASRMTPPLPAR